MSSKKRPGAVSPSCARLSLWLLIPERTPQTAWRVFGSAFAFSAAIVCGCLSFDFGKSVECSFRCAKHQVRLCVFAEEGLEIKTVMFFAFVCHGFLSFS